MKKIKNAFQVERLRNFYAKKGLDRKFYKLYSAKFPSINNLNSGVMWDDLNFSHSEMLSGSPVYKDKLSQIFNILKNKKGNLLDIGFGEGLIEKGLTKSNLKLFGIDISDRSVKTLNKTVSGQFKRGNILKIPFKSSLFNYVLCLDVLEHISPFNTFKALKQINRVLKPNSVLVISIPLNEGLEKMIKKRVNPNAHVRVYTPHIIKMELKISGFIVEKEIYLSAFSNYYFVKKYFNLIFKSKDPNLLIVVARKK